ncbi:MAG: hypothetical protein EA401_06950 [Planctomycetota bacterium]|nr:MAG: hypothetical protein EA401_06950 [Planctomycetota bacterium]
MSISTALAKRLTRCLQSIDRPLTFCTELVGPSIVPGLRIDRHGPVALPVTSATGKKLAAAGKPAPYGRGTRTVVDQGVRRVTMFPPKSCHIDHPGWADWLAARVDEVRDRLGLGERTLNAHLHQLLLYQKGDFFLPHQDGEKADGMVATMAVVLPSQCRGGDVVVRHGGQEQRFAFDQPARAFDFQVAAWYADCEHEIEVLAAGCRLVLIYNLVLKRTRSSPAISISAPHFGNEITELTKIIGRWVQSAQASDQGPAQRLVIPLEHAYSQRGLRLQRLKGQDEARARALFSAARTADCRAYLVHLTYQEMGEAISDYDGYYGDEPDEASVEMGDVFDWNLSAEQWTDSNGKRAHFGTITLCDEEILGGVAELKREVSEQDFEGYTGNAGMELTRWYHRAALVIWPANQHAAVLCQGSLSAGLAGLEEAVARYQRRPRLTDLQDEAIAFANAVMDAWPEHKGDGYGFLGQAADENGPLAGLIATLGQPDLARRYVTEILARDDQEQPGAASADLATCMGWSAALDATAKLFAQTTRYRLARDAQFLTHLCRRCPKQYHSAAQGLVQSLIEILLKPTTKKPGHYGGKRDQGGVLQSLISAMHQLDAQDLMLHLVRRMAKPQAPFDLVQTLVPTALKLAKQRKRLPAWPPFRKWLEDCRDAVARRIAQAPQPPNDWARPGISSMDRGNDTHYRLLDTFLRDPHQKDARFPLRENLRQDLQGIIACQQLDVTYVTERKGRPHSLVCTKTDGSYRRACAQHQHETELHQRLVRIMRY